MACLHHNTRCLIDCAGKVSVCGKTPDSFRIGSIYHGRNYNSNNSATEYFADINYRRYLDCEDFPFYRMYYTNYDYSNEQRDAKYSFRPIEGKAWFYLLMSNAKVMRYLDGVHIPEVFEYFFLFISEINANFAYPLFWQ